MDNDIINGVYLELDTLMDTRLSLLFDIDKDMMVPYITSGKYHNRYIDEFGYLSVKVFRTIYKKRNANVLNNPSPTMIMDLLSDYCYEALHSSKTFNNGKPINVFLNLYPYNLTEESKELIRMGMVNNLKSEVNVELLFKPYDEVTPSFINDEIGLMIMYDGLSWVEHHMLNKNLTKTSLPNVTLLTPMLLHRKLMIKESELGTFFEDVEKNMAMLIGINFIPTKFFSVKKEK